MALVYCATNKVNGKKYIGVTSKALVGRMRNHRNSAHSKSFFAFHCAIRKYGFEAFSWEILKENIDFAEAVLLEKEYILSFRAFIGFSDCTGYNMTLGGDGVLGLKWTPEQIQKLSDSHKGKPGFWSGKKRDPQVVARVSAKLRGRKYPGRVPHPSLHSDEAKRKAAISRVRVLKQNAKKIKNSLNEHFDSVLEASIAHGISAFSIYTSIRRKQQCYKIFWEYV